MNGYSIPKHIHWGGEGRLTGSVIEYERIGNVQSNCIEVFEDLSMWDKVSSELPCSKRFKMILSWTEDACFQWAIARVFSLIHETNHCLLKQNSQSRRKQTHTHNSFVCLTQRLICDFILWHAKVSSVIPVEWSSRPRRIRLITSDVESESPKSIKTLSYRDE